MYELESFHQSTFSQYRIVPSFHQNLLSTLSYNLVHNLITYKVETKYRALKHTSEGRGHFWVKYSACNRLGLVLCGSFA